MSLESLIKSDSSELKRLYKIFLDDTYELNILHEKLKTKKEDVVNAINHLMNDSDYLSVSTKEERDNINSLCEACKQ
jgi:hypothetical protein